MKTKTKQTKFKSQLDIEARILKERRQMFQEQALALKHEKKMVEHWDKANDDKLDAGKREWHRQKGHDEKKLMHRNLTLARRIEEIRLPKLKDALAAFKTKTFAFSDDDKSVVIN